MAKTTPLVKIIQNRTKKIANRKKWEQNEDSSGKKATKVI